MLGHCRRCYHYSVPLRKYLTASWAAVLEAWLQSLAGVTEGTRRDPPIMRPRAAGVRALWSGFVAGLLGIFTFNGGGDSNLPFSHSPEFNPAVWAGLFALDSRQNLDGAQEITRKLVSLGPPDIWPAPWDWNIGNPGFYTIVLSGS